MTILDLFDRAWDGPAWHGPSVSEALEGVDAAMAAARPLAGAHTIAELTEHIAVWQDVVRDSIVGGDTHVTPERDFGAPAKLDEAAWAGLRSRLQASRDGLRVAFAGFDPARLEQLHPPAGVPWSVVLHGAIHHDLYHAGQIAMLRRAVRG